MEPLDNSGSPEKKTEGTEGTKPKERPYYETHNEWFELDRENKKPGLYYHGAKEGKDGPEGRAASTFALVGMAGELAIEYGVVPWEQGAALQAAMWAFNEWRKFRGSGQTENRQVLQAVRDFILRHGDSRFSMFGDSGVTIRDRAGYWKGSENGRIYLFHSGALREAVPGYDMGRILDGLEQAGWIAERESGKRSNKYKVDGRSVSLYAVCMGEGGEDELG